MPKLVNIRLFKDNRNYAGDVFVSVNGESYLIQRGVRAARGRWRFRTARCFTRA